MTNAPLPATSPCSRVDVVAHEIQALSAVELFWQDTLCRAFSPGDFVVPAPDESARGAVAVLDIGVKSAITALRKARPACMNSHLQHTKSYF